MARFERNEQAKQEIADLLTDLLFTLFKLLFCYFIIFLILIGEIISDKM